MFEGNPFPGLRPFQFDENYLFFGREEQVSQLLQRLGNTRFLAVVGASGSGKSSLVRAGLLPELHGGTMTSTSIAWELAIMRPGGDPLTNLAESLVESGLFGEENEENILQTRATLSRSGLGLIEAFRHSSIDKGGNLLLLVDQFEEIFRFRQSGSKASQEATHFIQLLLETARQSEVPIYIILTMRSDFLGDCAEFKGLAEAVNEGEYLIPRLNRKQRARAIEGPVKVGGADISPRLKQQLLNDIGDDPDQLPILQHALMRMWDHWEVNTDKSQSLDLEHYDAIGRMAEALSRHADEVYDELPEDEHRLLCMKLFKAITEKQADGRGIRRPLSFGDIVEITGHRREEMLIVIDAFRPTGRTFIMPGEQVNIHNHIIIDISHESLMRVWVRLKKWVNEEADSARIYVRLCETAELHNRGEAGFYRDPDLKIALSWRDNNKPNANWGARINESFELAMRFLDDSKEDFGAEQKAKEEARKRELEQAKALAEAEKQRAAIQRNSAKRNKVFAVFLFILAVLTGVMAYQANLSEDVANQRLVDLNFKTANQYLDQDRPDRAIELLLKTYKEIKEDASIITKLGSILTTHHFPKHLGITSDAKMDLDMLEFRGLKISKNQNFATCINNSDNKSQLKILNLKSSSDVLIKEEFNQINFSDISADEKLAAIGGFSGEKNFIKIYDLENREALITIETEAPFDCGVFSGNNSILYAGSRNGELISISLETLERESLLKLSGQQFERLFQKPNSNDIIALSQNDGLGSIHQIIEKKYEFTIELPDTDGFYPFGTYSDDGKYFILGIGGFSYGKIIVFEGSLKNKIWENSSVHKRIIIGLDVSSDNEKLVTASLDKTAYIWNLKNGKLLSPVMQHDVFAWWAKFSADNSKIVTTTDNNSICIWNSKTGKILTPPFYTKDTILDVNFNEEGTKISAGLRNGEFHEWDIHSGRPINTALTHDEPITTTTVSGGGDFIATGDVAGNLKIWDKANGFLAPRTLTTKGKIGTIRIIDNDINLATLYENGVGSWGGVDIWNAKSLNNRYGIDFDLVEPEKIISAVEISPDGNYIAYSIEDENVIKIIDVKSNANRKIIYRHDNNIRGLFFSPNSKLLASVSFDGTSKIFEVKKGFKDPINLNYKFGFGGRVFFSHDSAKIAAATIVGADKNVVKIWRTNSGKLIKTLNHDYAVASVTFSKYNNSVYTGSSDLYVRFWKLDEIGNFPDFQLKHEDRIEFIEEYPDEELKHIILTVTDSGTVRIWDTNTQKAILGPIHNRSEVAPWQRCLTFIDQGAKFIYNHSREVIHISHFPADFYFNTSPKPILSLAEIFMNKQKGIPTSKMIYNDKETKPFADWYNENTSPKSFFINGASLGKMSDAYLKQNTSNSIHSSSLIRKK